MSDFEHDDELRDALKRAHPARNEANPVLAANRARMVRARSRRRAAIGSVTAAAFVVAGAAFFAANGANDTDTIDVVAPPGTAIIATTTAPARSLEPTTSISPATTAPAGIDQPTTTSPPAPPSTTVTTTTRATSTSTLPSTTTATPGTRRTVTGRGGTITVTWTSSAITVVSITDEIGWTHSVQNKSDDVEVDWRRSNPDDEAKIRVRLNDGELREEID